MGKEKTPQISNTYDWWEDIAPIREVVYSCIECGYEEMRMEEISGDTFQCPVCPNLQWMQVK